MAALVCDICGGKLTMVSGGIAVCDSCGMEHTKERMQEKVQEIKGVVRVDNSHMIENYLVMAQNAYHSGNQGEAELYCNKIIEIDPKSYQAWLLKGKSAGWQSTLQSPRFSEAVSAFSKAIDNAPEGERDEIIEETKGEIKKLAVALISLRGDIFASCPDENEANGFSSDICSILDAIMQYFIQSGNSISHSEIFEPIACQINDAVVKAWSEKIFPDYIGDEQRPGEYEFREFIHRARYCTDLLEKAISLCDEDDEADIPRYENLINFHTEVIESCAWDYDIIVTGKSWFKTEILTQEAMQFRRNCITQYQAKITEIKEKKAAKEKADADARINKYWENHPEDKTKLDVECRSLTQTIASLNDEINNVPGQAEITNFQDRISNLKADKDALSIFKGKEKKAIQEQIDVAISVLNRVQSRRNTAIEEIKRKIDPLEQRKEAIEAEFTKDR